MANNAFSLWNRVAPIAPSILSSTRIIAAPVLLNMLAAGEPYSFIFYFAACATDILDGKIARSLKSATIRGSVLDASADFILVFSGFFFFTNRGIVSPALLFTMVVSFAYYLLTIKAVVRSMLGKYVGTVLFVLLGAMVLSPTKVVGTCVSWIGVLYIMSSTIIRFANLCVIKN